MKIKLKSAPKKSKAVVNLDELPLDVDEHAIEAPPGVDPLRGKRLTLDQIDPDVVYIVRCLRGFEQVDLPAMGWEIIRNHPLKHVDAGVCRFFVGVSLPKGPYKFLTLFKDERTKAESVMALREWTASDGKFTPYDQQAAKRKAEGTKAKKIPIRLPREFWPDYAAGLWEKHPARPVKRAKATSKKFKLKLRKANHDTDPSGTANRSGGKNRGKGKRIRLQR